MVPTIGAVVRTANLGETAVARLRRTRCARNEGESRFCHGFALIYQSHRGKYGSSVSPEGLDRAIGTSRRAARIGLMICTSHRPISALAIAVCMFVTPA